VQIITKTKATAPRKTNVSVVGDGKKAGKKTGSKNIMERLGDIQYIIIYI